MFQTLLIVLFFVEYLKTEFFYLKLNTVKKLQFSENLFIEK